MPRVKNSARKDGRLQSKIYLGNGKYKYVYATTQKELAEKVQEIKIKLGKGIDVVSQRDTFESWGKRWLKKKSSRVSYNWANALGTNFKKLSPIYNSEIAELRRIDLEDILDDLFHEGYSERVIKAVRDIASGIMEMCVENRVIEYNPFRATELPKVQSDNERRALTAEERRWVEETPHRAQTAAMIMMYAGLRRGELIPLTWQDIDLDAGTISVNKSVEMIKGHPSLKSGGKTNSATRIVYIPKVLVEYLKPLAGNPFALVCTSAKGKMMSDSSWRRMWDSYIRDLNMKYADFGSFIVKENPMKRPTSKCRPGGVPILIPRFTAHWLRHTFITMMYLSGVDVLTAAEQAGHSDPKITMEIYTHLDSMYKKRTMEKLDSYIDGCQIGVENSEKPQYKDKVS